MKARALVPLKDLVQAKSRLSGLLRPAERRALAQAMAEDVLTTLSQHSQINQVILVSDDPGAAMLANKYGAEHWPEESLECRGLNRVIGRSCDLLFAQSDSPVVVLHADLPCLTGEDVTAVLHAIRVTGGLIIACDRHAQGTNLLAFDAGNRPEFLFGVDSCARHCASARELGIEYRVLHRPGSSLDVDMPEDIKLFIAQVDRGAAGHSANMLQQPTTGPRIRAQLDSMVVTLQSADKLRAKVSHLNG